MVMRDFNDPGQYGQLKEKVVINATGYAARDLWRDKTVFPVRGQTGWLVPQHDAPYSLRYKNASLMSKSDGIVVMNNPIDLGEMFGVGDSMEWPDPAPILEVMKIVEPIMAGMKGIDEADQHDACRGAGSFGAAACSAGTAGGVYTEAQAAQGADLCRTLRHVSRQAGRGTWEVPALKGKFMANWGKESVAALSDYLARAMPQFAPGTLEPADNVKLVAFLLKTNGHPAGAKPLPEDHAALAAIRIDPIPANAVK
jgi:hypothetical protein